MASAPLDPYKEVPFIKSQRVKFSISSPFTPTYVVSHLTQVSDPAAMYANRVRGRHMLLENPAKESRTKKQTEEKRARRHAHTERLRLGVTGRREAKEKGFWKFDKSQMKFNNMLPLHHLWMDYMSELLGLAQSGSMNSDTKAFPQTYSSAGIHPKLVKADFHGSMMSVSQSRNPSLIGLSGIVILDTENAFTVVTTKDKVKLIPKQNSIFVFSVPLYHTSSTKRSTKHSAESSTSPIPLEPQAGEEPSNTCSWTVLDLPHIDFELYGNQFRFRSADRAGRKFKHKETIEL
ncbi:hypothetical protein AX17_006579 [Amanita inopinata Kibby_2008]|nr:hypothetical protein AX17_006579 [Amanita inopinata Kibby_2008]